MTSSASGNNVSINAAIAGTGTGNYYGIYGQGNNATGSGTVYGVWGVGYGSGTGVRYGVYGGASIQAAGQIGYGVYGIASGSLSGTKYGIYGDATGAGTLYAGYFAGGNVYVQNNLGVGNASPTFKLDVTGNSRFTGTMQIGTYTLPAIDGAANYVLKTNGAGTVSWQPDNTGSGTVTGSGTTNYLAKWNSASGLTNSVVYDDGTNAVVGVGLPAVTGGSSRTLTIGSTNAYTTDDASLELVGGGASTLDTLGKITFVATTTGPTYTPEGMIYGARGGDLVFLTRGSGLAERMRILSTGSVGIGSTASAPTSTVDVSGSFAISNQLTVAATAIASLTGDQSVVFAGSGATITLQPASSCKGRIVIVKGTTSGTTFAIQSSGGNIDGATGYTPGTVAGVRRCVTLISDGTNWNIISVY